MKGLNDLIRKKNALMSSNKNKWEKFSKNQFNNTFMIKKKS